MQRFLKTSLMRFSNAKTVAPYYTLDFDPYTVDENEYKDMDSKLKYTTGYALIDVEPFPRYKLMKLGKHFLHRYKNEIPESAMFRVYQEEKVKWIMEMAHKHKDILTLEEKLGTDCIEIFIEDLAEENQLIDFMKVEQPWNFQPEESHADFIAFAGERNESTLRHEKRLKETPRAVIEE